MSNNKLRKRERHIRTLGLIALSIVAILLLPLLLATVAPAGVMLAIVPVVSTKKGKEDDADDGEGTFQEKLLRGVEALQATIKAHDEALNGKEGVMAKVQAALNDLSSKMIALQKAQRSLKSHLSTPGKISEDCARWLGALAIGRALAKGWLKGDRAEGIVKDVIGMESRAALTTTDIALPDEYQGEVVELVAQYGSARKYGTVFPLGTASVKLPRLKTSPAFGLIAMSAAITQKSPQVEFVTFAPEKWGGLVILPNEMNEDSVIALGQFVARYSAREMAKIEDTVFWAADGTATYDSLKGLLLSTSAANDNKLVTLAAGKTKTSDIDLAACRDMRAGVDSAALNSGAYYFHPSFEQACSRFNTAGDKPYVANGINGATLDGFPIHWVDVLPVYNKTATISTIFGLFGDASFHYLGVRGGMRYDVSDQAGFANDQLYIRALERFTIGKMAAGCVCGVATPAA
jgi:HK97 family phage major capsid protein